MALFKGSIQAISDAPSDVDSVKAIMDALVENQTITRDVGELVKHALEAARDELEKAIDARPKAAAKSKE